MTEMTDKPRILVLCTGNSARSQMAEGLIRNTFGDRFEVYSAGTHPSSIRPEAIKVLSEIGIDISRHRSKSVDEFSGTKMDYVLTVCDNAKENCPYFPAGTRLMHHAFPDPAIVPGGENERLAAFRTVRDDLRAFIDSDLAKMLGQ